MLSAIRYTFAENARSFDEVLGGVIMDFLSLLSDPDLASPPRSRVLKCAQTHSYCRLSAALRFLRSTLLLARGHT